MQTTGYAVMSDTHPAGHFFVSGDTHQYQIFYSRKGAQDEVDRLNAGHAAHQTGVTFYVGEVTITRS